MVHEYKRINGKTAPCCVGDTFKGNETISQTREFMLKGEKPDSCLKCFKEEDAGHRSKRQWETAKWVDELGLEDIIGETQEDGSIPPRVRYIDLRLGSKCQLACVMCSPHDSSGWVKEYKQIYPDLKNERLQKSQLWEKDSGKLAWSGGSYAWHKSNPTFWDEFWTQVPTLRQLYCAGGEALIMKHMIHMARQLHNLIVYLFFIRFILHWLSIVVIVLRLHVSRILTFITGHFI